MNRILSNSQLLRSIAKCRTKVYYKSLEAAQKKLPSIQEKHGKNFRVYYCQDCGNYHYTSRVT